MRDLLVRAELLQVLVGVLGEERDDRAQLQPAQEAVVGVRQNNLS
jgi:hypothetical protein